MGKRPQPEECWPVEARIPVPVSWFTDCRDLTNVDNFWRVLQGDVENMNKIVVRSMDKLFGKNNDGLIGLTRPLHT
jgi:hypothetical protein